MRKIISAALAVIGIAAYAQEKMAYPIEHVPNSVDAYHDAAFYTSGGKTYNLKNFAISKSDTILAFKASPNGQVCAVVSGKKGKSLEPQIALYSLWEQNKKLAQAKKVEFVPTAACFTGQGSLLLVSDNAGVLHSYLPEKLAPATTATLPSAATALAASPDNSMVAAACGSTVELLFTPSLGVKGTLNLDGNVNDMAFSGDSKQLAVLTDKGMLKIYDMVTLAQTNSIDALGMAKAAAFNPEGKHIAVVTGDSRISILNLLNPNEREYIDAEGAGVKFVRFVNVYPNKGAFLLYNTNESMNYLDMSHLSPLRSQLIADRLQEKMDEWSQRLPGESLEDYSLRVNDQTRMEQMKLFEQEIATQMALEELGMAQMQMGNYNTDLQMLALGLDGGLGDIFLTVPQNELGAFLEPGNLEFQNVKYGLNAMDEFELLYADIYNKETGKTYTYNNLDGQFINYIADEATFTPIEIANQAYLEENSLSGITDLVMEEAKEQNILSDHTRISVETQVVSAVNSLGQNVRNYEVGITYTVDQGYSAREDYGAGKYKLADSPAGLAMMKIVAQALGKDFAKYMVPGKKVTIDIAGTADATPIRRVIPYDGCYGDFVDQPVSFDGEPSQVTVTKQTGITQNEQLAFLRAVGVKDKLFSDVSMLDKMDTDVNYDISVSKEAGSEYRKVSVKFTFYDAFK